MLNLIIIEPAGVCFNGEIESITLPSRSGRFTVFPHHAPVISLLEKGEVVYKTKGSSSTQTHPIKGGFAHIDKDKVTLCTEQ